MRRINTPSIRLGIATFAAALALTAAGCNKSGSDSTTPPDARANLALKVLVIDQQAVLQTSAAGQDVGRQAAALRDQIQAEVVAEQQAIVAANKDLEVNAKVYSPAQRDQKIRALEARQRAYPVFEQRKQQILQLSIQRASNQIATTLRPILQTIIDENKATILLDKNALMYSIPSYEITDEAIKRLNEKLKTVKVERVSLDTAPPPGSQGAGPRPQQ